jgi:hypothetical protein
MAVKWHQTGGVFVNAKVLTSQLNSSQHAHARVCDEDIHASDDDAYTAQNNTFDCHVAQ